MQFADAQRDMGKAYVGGAPGVLVSGLVWLVAGSLALGVGDGMAFTALFFGGMVIWPASLALARLVFGAPPVTPGNPLDRLGLESTFVLFGGIAIAYAVLRVAPGLAVPAVAVTIGVRYFIFRTLYDEPLYWLLGGAIAAMGVFGALGNAVSSAHLALVVGAIELGFAVMLYRRWKRRP